MWVGPGFSLGTSWLARFPTDTDNHIREYYTYCLQTLNAVFSSVKERNSAIDIRITVPQLYVLKTADRTFSEALNTASGGQPLNGNIFLSNFTDWIPQQAVNGAIGGR
nr:hypothetical protein BaRGS_026668 [Batillaria attramentaria]